MPQQTVARSSTIAEIFAVSDAFDELEFVDGMLRELGLTPPQYVVYNDNATAVISAYRSTGKRTKAANIRFAQCREWVETARAIVRRISGTDNPADMLSKAVTAVVHRRHCLVVLGMDPDGVKTLVSKWGPDLRVPRLKPSDDAVAQ